MKYLTLEEVKNTELNILIKFDEFCKKEGLYYTLSGGTLLGAIRHKGFIPWDDDIDVMMPREDYDSFLKLVTCSKICNFLNILKPGDNNYFYPFAKLCDSRTVAQMEDNNSKHGIWIDIFPLDNLPEDEKKLKQLFKKTRFWRAVIISMTTNLSGEKNILKKTIKAFLMCFANIIGKEKVIKKASSISQTYDNTESEYIGCAIWGYGPGERMVKKDFFVRCPIDFEELSFNAPKCWKEYLEGLYGDYMQLPPEGKRKTHQLKAWKISD